MGFLRNHQDDRIFRGATVTMRTNTNFGRTTFDVYCSQCHLVGTLDLESRGSAPNEEIVRRLADEHREWHKAGLKSGRPAPNPGQCRPRYLRS
ncbi:hypothetical protein AB0M92_18975 [Streptomyces sp. NPDC051582]|uniref:hypothetical protein n=1 Tax=Streptomyces sp. NPDC051582 TaxID=3155167 RepID=UPI00342AA4C5